MKTTPEPIATPRLADRLLLAFLAVLFAATEIAGIFVPTTALRFVSPGPPPVIERQAAPLPEAVPPPLQIAVARVPDVERLRALFGAARFDLAAVREGASPVPAVFLAALPTDLANLKQVAERKDLFVRIVLPLILHRNAVVLEDRRRLRRLGHLVVADLSPRDREWLLRLARHYRVLDEKAGVESVSETMRLDLLRRVDVVPVSLALAQAAAESGWGTSRFARQGNALFGQWTWDESAGIIPGERDQDRAHAVRAFRGLSQSVRAYVHNLNISHHYAGFRAAREVLRKAGPPDGDWGRVLAGELGAYSEEGPEYIRKIRLIMRVNDFGAFETTPLAIRPEGGRADRPTG